MICRSDTCVDIHRLQKHRIDSDVAIVVPNVVFLARAVNGHIQLGLVDTVNIKLLRSGTSTSGRH